MSLKLSAAVGAIVAVTLVALGLWGWMAAPRLAASADNVRRALFGIRFGAVAAVAGAQAVGIGIVVDTFYARDRLSAALETITALVCAAALLSVLVICSGQ